MRIEKHGNLYAVVDGTLGTLCQSHTRAQAESFIQERQGLKTALVDYRNTTRHALKYGACCNY